MNHSEFQLRGVSDQRLAIHATSPLPAWLWSVDGSRVLWANPVGARLFGAANSTALAGKAFGPADPHRRQVAQLANRLPASGALRLQRLRGFGAPLGSLVTCACIRISFCDGSHGILIAVPEPIGRTMPLVERLQRLVEGIDAPIAAFDRDGRFVGANTAAHSLPSPADLTGPGLDEARLEALRQGRVELPVGPNRLVIQRVGVGADAGLVVLMATEPEQEPHVTAPDHPTSDSNYEQPEMSGEAPAEFALIETAAEPAAAAGTEVAPPPSDEERTAETDETEPAAGSSQASAPVDTPDAPAPDAGADAASHEPSPYIEPVADEPLATDEPASPLAAPPWLEELARHPRRLPLRFLWQMDGNSRFSLDSEEFSYLIGAHATSAFGRPWGEIADSFGLDPDGRVLKAFATHDTWSGITLDWPVDGGDNLAVELAGLPVYDRARNFAGYRGFGVCRDLDGLARLVALRRYELSHPPLLPQALSADIVTARRSAEPAEAIQASDPAPVAPVAADEPDPATSEISQATDSNATVEIPANVVPFRPTSDAKLPTLTPGENRAFNELARQLAERLERNKPALPSAAHADETAGSLGSEPPHDPTKAAETPDISEPARWLTPAEPPAKGDSRDRSLLDLVPTGILIYRLDRLLYANPAFLQRVGYDSLHALEDAGGLDALYVESGTSAASSTADAGTPVTISAGEAASEQVPTEARLHSISWDGDSALALICSAAPPESTAAAKVETTSEPDPASVPSSPGHANAEELATILDTTADGILMFDGEGAISSCNRSAEALFGHDGDELVRHNFLALFAPESQPAVRDYLESVRSADLASLLDHGRDVLARVRGGGLIPVSMILGRTQAQGPNFFAMFRDQSQVRKSENELREARGLADRAANAKADMLARISHEVRAPLNAILGFAEVMIGERFGALGNERYGEYLKDIRASGERVIAVINDLSDLSRVETGKLDLSFSNQNLNDLVEQCVAAMQPQANRGRIIIRTSLAHTLPSVVADAHTLRQITLNLIGNSIRLANAGGQVIVSTALSDFGDVVLRVRDTGHGMNDNEVAAALQPFRSPAPSEQAGDNAGLNLSLTKALVEANGAHFQIRTGPHSGTLIEVVFSRAAARA